MATSKIKIEKTANGVDANSMLRRFLHDSAANDATSTLIKISYVMHK